MNEKRSVRKIGARHRLSDREHIQVVHDLSAELGASCPGAEAKVAGMRSFICKIQGLQEALRDPGITTEAALEKVYDFLGEEYDPESGELRKIDTPKDAVNALLAGGLAIAKSAGLPNIAAAIEKTQAAANRAIEAMNAAASDEISKRGQQEGLAESMAQTWLRPPDAWPHVQKSGKEGEK